MFALVLTAYLTSLALSAQGSAAASPRNDDLSDARTLRVGASVRGTVNDATRQRGEPRHARSALFTRSVWYRYRARRKRSITLGTCRSNFDTVVAVYTGRSPRSLRPVDFNDDGCGHDVGSRVTFTARRGRTYRIAVAGFAPGRFTLTVKSLNRPFNDDFVDAHRVALGSQARGTTRNATRELDEPRHANENADQTVWFRLTVAARTRVELNTCGSRFATVLAVYTGSRVGRLREVKSNDKGCGLESDNDRVRFTARRGVTYRVALAELIPGKAAALSSPQDRSVRRNVRSA